MFKEFEKLSKKDDTAGKEELATQICKELSVHTQLEEEIPVARETIDEDVYRFQGITKSVITVRASF